MKMDFADAMRAATKLTRAQKLMEATRVIQSALLLGRGQTEPADEQAVEGRAIEKFMIDITPDVTRPAIAGTARGRPRRGRWVMLPRRLVRPSFQASGSMAWRASGRASLSRSPTALST